ncbi:MFS transporter [Niveispirillum sp. KHB5.9]|uniref:MFS transporter n=1 Tax=Niveispirillum sp. KHB5.9 TaxID=3400269 RepID=UPI003A89E4A8
MNADASGAATGTLRAWSMVAILSTLYIVSFVDRFVLGLLVGPLKADLGVSDLQIGFLFGTAFAVFYGIVGIPVARLADKGDRRRLILAGVGLWSCCTILSGFSSTFLALVLLRIGLAVGEAVLTPATYSLIGDVLPKERRGLAASIYNACGMFGASGAYIVAALAIGWIYAVESSGELGGLKLWQVIFIIVGVPGLVLATLFALVAREPARSTVPGLAGAPTLRDVMRYAVGNARLYFALFLGAGCLQIMTNAYLAWGPTFLSRTYGMPVAEAGRTYGLFNMLALVGGTILIPMLTRRLRRPDALPLVSAACGFVGGGFCLAAPLQGTATGFLALAWAGLFLAGGGGNNVLAAIHSIVPRPMQATMTALLLICMSTLALGVGPLAAAFFAGLAAGAANPLAMGLMIVSVLAAAVGVTLFALARAPVAAYVTANR